jgi:hypothetical protein
MVGVGTRKARAISSVERPPRVRSVSATCASGRERRVAAREDQAQAVLGQGAVALVRAEAARGRGAVRARRQHRRRGWRRLLEVPRDLVLLAREEGAAAHAVDGLVARGGDEPARGVAGHALLGPLLERRRYGFLQGLLRGVEVAEEADQRGQDAAVLGAEDLLPGAACPPSQATSRFVPRPPPRRSTITWQVIAGH